jgi:hypothetical protein
MKLHKSMPNGKTDLNNFGAVRTDHIGEPRLARSRLR